MSLSILLSEIEETKVPDLCCARHQSDATITVSGDVSGDRPACFIKLDRHSSCARDGDSAREQARIMIWQKNLCEDHGNCVQGVENGDRHTFSSGNCWTRLQVYGIHHKSWKDFSSTNNFYCDNERDNKAGRQRKHSTRKQAIPSPSAMEGLLGETTNNTIILYTVGAMIGTFACETMRGSLYWATALERDDADYW